MSQQSYHQQTATGADINFTITTFSSDELLVYVDGVKKDAGVHYNINPYNSNSQSTVDWIGTPPSNPSIVRIVRQTDVLNSGNNAVEGKATFQAGSSVKADDLNNNTKQVLRAIQELQDQKIQGYDLQDNTIGALQIAPNAVGSSELADNAVDTAAIQDDAVNADKLANSINSAIAANTAKQTNVTTNLTTSTSTTSVTVISSDGTNATIGEATGSAAGVMSVAHHDKLDGIEAGATGNQTNAEIRAAVEAASDSNVFTDADHSKLNAIEAGAEVNPTNAEIRAAVEAASDSNVFTDADHSKLDGIEAGATADQTDAQIRAAVEAASDSNVFTDADHTKLNNAATLTDAQTLTNKTLTSPVINDFSGTAIVTSGTSTSDNKVYSAKRSDELYSTGASQAATSATAAANSATAAASSATAAASSATSAASSATTATTQASTATTQAANALTHLNTFKSQYLGALSSDPSVDSVGNAVDQGDIYFNTTSEQVRVHNGAVFQGISENSVDVDKFATSDFSALYTASAGSNSIDLGGLAISGSVFSTETIPGIRASLAKGSATYNLGGI